MQRKTKSVRSGASGQLGTATLAALDNLADVWRQLDALQPKVLAIKPAASFTLEEYAARYKVLQSTAKGRLRSALTQGNLERVRVCLPDTAGRMVPTWCYSIAKKA